LEAPPQQESSSIEAIQNNKMNDSKLQANPDALEAPTQQDFSSVEVRDVQAPLRVFSKNGSAKKKKKKHHKVKVQQAPVVPKVELSPEEKQKQRSTAWMAFFKRCCLVFGMAIISGVMALTDLDDNVLSLCVSLILNGILVFDVHKKYGTIVAVVVQCLYGLAIIGIVLLARLINEMDEYAKKFKVQEALLHEDFTYEELGPESFGGPPIQTTCDLEELMRDASAIQPDLVRLVIVPLYEAGSAEGQCERVGPNLKGISRAREKGRNDYNNHFEYLCDLVRFTIVCKDFRVLLIVYTVLYQLADDGVIIIVRNKNRFKNGSIAGAGYCDANINFSMQGHVCECQLQYLPFYNLKQGQHKVYEVVRSLQMEGALKTVPDDTPVPMIERVVCTTLILSSAMTAQWQSLLYMHYHWAGFATWNDSEQPVLASVHTALLITPFSLVTYVCLARLCRALSAQNKGVGMAAQAACAVLMVLLTIFLDPEVLLQTPNASQWTDIGGGYWTQEQSAWTVLMSVLAESNDVYLKAAERNDSTVVSAIVRIPYIIVALFFVRDLYASFLQTGSGRRIRSRTGMMYDQYLGPYGEYYQHRILVQQFVTVVWQARVKLPILSAAVSSAEVTRSAVLEPNLHIAVAAYWIVVGALVLNALYPVLLLQFGNSRWLRDLSMGLDATFDAVYSVAYTVALHFIVGAVSAPSDVLLYASTLYSTFHIFTVAAGLELSVMQQAADAKSHRTFVKFKRAEEAQRKVSLPLAWALALVQGLVIILVIMFQCGGSYPLEETGDPCRPCECDDDGFLTSCVVPALVLPNSLYMRDRGIAGVRPGVFDVVGFEALTDVELGSNILDEVWSLPETVKHLDLQKCKLDVNASTSLAAALKGAENLRSVYLNGNSIGGSDKTAVKHVHSFDPSNDYCARVPNKKNSCC